MNKKAKRALKHFLYIVTSIPLIIMIFIKLGLPALGETELAYKLWSSYRFLIYPIMLGGALSIYLHRCEDCDKQLYGFFWNTRCSDCQKH